jgi:hypothetical protein
MNTESQIPRPTFVNPIAGGVVGALVGAFLRFVVAILFLWYIEHWGAAGKIVREADFNVYELTAVSALIGLVIGGIAGLTCHPLLGTIVGAIGSGGSCWLLFVVPVGMFGRLPDKGGAMTEIFWGWFAMTVAGAIAGGIGATVGRRGWKRK